MKAVIASVFCAAALVATYPTATFAGQDRATTSDSRDGSLDRKITRRLRNGATLKRYDLHVSVDRGVATLTGAVPSERQRRRAAQLARSSGAARVDNQIAVDRDAATGTTGRLERDARDTGHRAKEGISDTWITTTIKTKFMGEEGTRASDISVDTNGHIVTLTGRAVSEAAREKAVQIARDTDGVARVVDRLRVEPRL